MPPLDPSDYRSLTSAAGFVVTGARTRIEIAGADRATFLHNLCTQEIRRLEIGQGREAFLTNAQGRILGFVTVFAGNDSLMLETEPGAGERLATHLERYHIREDVLIADRSAEWGELVVAGPDAAAALAVLVDDPAARAWLAAAEPWSFRQIDLAGRQVEVRRGGWVRPWAAAVASRAEEFDALPATLEQAGIRRCGTEAWEALRIEAGFPRDRVDITEENLPQEVDRDRTAISFTKGCYIGQETVARIDALGHVNRLLRGVRFRGEVVPAAGLELTSSGKALGRVTSATWSPALRAPLALAYVRRGHDEPGAALDSALGAAEVVRLPIDVAG